MVSLYLSGIALVALSLYLQRACLSLVALVAHTHSLSISARLNQALKTMLSSLASPVERAVALRLVEGLVALRLSLLRPAEAACARADRQAGCCCACAQPEARCAEA